MRRLHPSPTSAQRGVGALVVVMILFFIMSMVAAYASRNLIFEQRTSANNYRAVQSFEAAEAGLEWAIAMLNGGRIDAACMPSQVQTDDTFRQRYLDIDAFDAVKVRRWVNAGVDDDLLPTCVRGAVGWDCTCPSNGAPVVAVPSGTALAPAFQVRFFRPEAVAGKPVIRIQSQSCSTYSASCFDPAGRKSDAISELNALVGMAAPLRQAPAAALTVRGALGAAPPVAQVVNEDGVIINAGGLIDASISVKGPPGSPPGEFSRGNDLTLNILAENGMTAGERMFLATFGMSPRTYRTQPAVVRLACGAECSVALQAAANQFPGRTIWIDGDLNLDGPLTMGSVASPTMLVVDGSIVFGPASNVAITGLVYSRGASWTNAGGAALVQGAFVAEGDKDVANDGNFNITGAPVIVFDTGVVGHLQKARARLVLDYGSMARVPGSWREF